MTSVLRSFTQIPARIKYFLVLETIYGIREMSFTYRSALILPSLPAPIQTQTEFTGTYNDPSGYVIPDVAAGQLLKDLGQQFTITDANFNHRAIYRRVQPVRGVDSEGVGGSSGDSWGTFYVKVWDSDASSYPIVVTRTG
jgi:hypothetical protein